MHATYIIHVMTLWYLPCNCPIVEQSLEEADRALTTNVYLAQRILQTALNKSGISVDLVSCYIKVMFINGYKI